METFYTDERNVQMLIGLMKAHGIKKIVASPGATNVCFVGSIQKDTYFEIYSSVDERSAAYIACGLASESGEPVALTCTGATASRNYISGLTEAYYRKLPILAITATQSTGRIGHHFPQVIDRSILLKDIAMLSVQAMRIRDDEDEWTCEVSLNKALLELRHRGGGPVHINLETVYSKNYTIQQLPPVRMIERLEYKNLMPPLEASKVGVYVGSHSAWDSKLIQLLDKFCELYNGVVFCDHTSNYIGKYSVFPSLVCCQSRYTTPCRDMDIMIHIGNVSGAEFCLNPRQVWRVNPDGEIRDTFKKLRYVFEMEENEFFSRYIQAANKTQKEHSYYSQWELECKKNRNEIPEVPFSNVWIAQHTIDKLPKECELHLGILNSLRTWNFFEKEKNILGYSNTGGFGIDGCVSALVGASFMDAKKLYFGVVGDLAFFYDLNVLGNRHIGNNIRLLMINNGCGTEFRNYNHKAAYFEDDADLYIAAAGHYGNQSKRLVYHFAQDLGFEYISASTKEEFTEKAEYFVQPELTNKSIIFEVFTNSQEESDAVKIMNNLQSSVQGTMKQVAKDIIGEKGTYMLKKIIQK